jgi:uncharacterized membrane protein YhhN
VNGGSWALLAVLAVVCVGNWWSRYRNIASLEVATKPVATVLAGALCIVHGDGGSVTAIAVIGFLLCLAGDVFLLPQIDQFVAGLASFLLGHIAFVVACVVAGLDEPSWAFPSIIVIGFVMATVGRQVLDGARSKEPALLIPVTAYLVVIGSMFVVASATGRVAAVIGAAFFVTSDSILGFDKFARRQPWADVAIMVTYHLALGSLALGL